MDHIYAPNFIYRSNYPIYLFLSLRYSCCKILTGNIYIYWICIHTHIYIYIVFPNWLFCYDEMTLTYIYAKNRKPLVEMITFRSLGTKHIVWGTDCSGATFWRCLSQSHSVCCTQQTDIATRAPEIWEWMSGTHLWSNATLQLLHC